MWCTGKALPRALGVRSVVAAAAAAVATAGVSGCAPGEDVEILPPVTAQTPSPPVDFDGSLEPSAAVLSLVPDDPERVVTLTVTDFEQVRLGLGQPDLGTDDPRPEREAFWARAEAERPLLTPGLLRPVEQRLQRQHGLSRLDVAWEAHFSDATGRETGWVLAFRDGTDMAAVQAAVDGGLAPLAGADVDAERGLASLGTAASGEESWAAVPEVRALVGSPADATYVSRACVEQVQPGEGDASSAGGLDPLEAWSLQLQGTLATARLGEGRRDLFDRMRAGSAQPAFADVYEGGVADPLTGRVGYVMTDPAAAARMATGRDLPFAACP